MKPYFFVTDSGALFDTRKPDLVHQPLRAYYARHFRIILTGAELRASLRAGKFAFPGGHEVYAITSDGAVLCFDCVRRELPSVIAAIRSRANDGWRVTHLESACETDCFTACDHCGRVIVEDWEDDTE